MKVPYFVATAVARGDLRQVVIPIVARPGHAAMLHGMRDGRITTRIRITIHAHATSTLELTDPADQRYWVQTHDRAWCQRQHKLLISYGDTPDQATDAIHAITPCRYQDKWNGAPVSVLNVTAMLDAPRLLAARSELGYVTNPAVALPHEPEAIPNDWLNRDWVEHAQARHAKAVRHRHDLERQATRLLTSEQRMTQARQAARRNHVDVTGELLVLRQAMRRNANQEQVAHRLEAVEDKANRRAA